MPEATFRGRSEIDLEDAVKTEAAIVEAKPTAIVNAAAYTAVDKAEEEPAKAWLVNAEGVAAVARVAATLNIPLVHVSTDYVFDGTGNRPYRDSDGTRPINTYGRTKLAGELAVASLCSQYQILRASWVFSEFDGNFVTTMLRLARERDVISVVSDQQGRPTYVGHLAQAIAEIVAGKSTTAVPPGVYHFGGGPDTNWHEFAKVIISRAAEEGLIDIVPSIDPIATARFPTRAKRPMYSVLEPSVALQRALSFTPDWQMGLDDTLHRLKTLRAD